MEDQFAHRLDPILKITAVNPVADLEITARIIRKEYNLK